MTEIRFDKTRYHQYMDMIEWCTMQFGPGWGSQIFSDDKPNRPWGYTIMFGNTYWMFRDDKHAVLFSLRWA